MILIREIKPIKITGITSFLVTFKYNVIYSGIMENLGRWVAYYHKKLSSWEIPLKCLSTVLDQLTYYDEIELILMKSDSESPNQHDFVLTQNEIDSFRVRPFSHQIEAINFGLDPKHKKWLNLSSMGTGKTLELIYLAETLKRRGLIEHCFIVTCVDSLRQNLKAEIEAFSTESVIVLGEKRRKTGKLYYDTIANRAKQLQEPIEEFFVITNIASLRYPDMVNAFQKSKNTFGLIGVDEVHRSTKGSIQGDNLLKLDSEYKVAMSGSLVTNSPISCYLPLSWIRVDSSTMTTFKSHYCVFAGFHDSQIIGYRYLDILREEIESCSIRVKLEDIRDDMPSKSISVELVEMSEEQADFYDAIKEGIIEEADRIELNSANLLALTTRLRQATSDPGILTSQDIPSGKVERCTELVEDLVNSGERVVVMDVFKKSIYQLAERLKDLNPLVVTGDIDDSTVQANIQKFRSDSGAKILLGTTQKLGTGFSLPEAHYMIMLSTPWTYAEFSQNTDRIHRVNSECPVYIKVLITKDTIDEKVWEIISKKKELSDYLVDEYSAEQAEALRQEMLQIIQDLKIKEN